MIEMDEHDPLHRLTTYRPGRALIDSEWSPRDQADRARRDHDVVPREHACDGGARLPRLNPAAVSAAAIAAIIVGVVLVAVHPGRNPGRGGADRPRSFAAAQNTATVGDGQYARRTMTTYRVDADGTATQTAQGTVWAAPDGALWMDGTLSAAGCAHFAAPSGGDFEQPTTAFFDQLPTTPGDLESFMRAHTSGSSSQDEALFVATGDMLRDTDLLASAQLRAAAVSVLSGLSGVTAAHGRDRLPRPTRDPPRLGEPGSASGRGVLALLRSGDLPAARGAGRTERGTGQLRRPLTGLFGATNPAPHRPRTTWRTPPRSR